MSIRKENFDIETVRRSLKSFSRLTLDEERDLQEAQYEIEENCTTVAYGTIGDKRLICDYTYIH